ncbi:uncharacterized protein B0H18DRAFT_670339 [Fomitopsis serialis]|uniref:uncharacterized protein n=1 Tax=Fomitopsis serialis TaxID=139415 RepID=UPI002008D96A|nr:uncharacterized protein B0H18DRAFT_670339 [Neoantrodia serialis]KAH9932878.1 hypothetical protein B0H18DRAFT_670339 [Neoantrodia serialis]
MSNNESDSSTSQASGSKTKPRAPARPRGACMHCKSLKIRCDIIPDEDICVRCKANDFDCVSYGRKKRRPAPAHEELQQRACSQDVQIQALLRKLDEIKSLTKIRYWIAQAQQETEALQTGARGCLSPKVSGWVASGDCEPKVNGWVPRAEKDIPMSVPRPLTPVPSATNPKWPPILRCGLFGPQEVTDLFKLFYCKLHPSFTVLDPALHTPQYLISTSTLLFTKVLSITSRYWTHRPKLHQLAATYAHEAATEAIREGHYTIETCQAFTLSTGFPAPRQRFSEHRAWLLTGISIQILQALKLNAPPPADLPERERLNRIRTWFQVVCIDASSSVQQGKAPVLQGSDYVARALPAWYRCSPLNSPYDVYLCAFTDLALLVAKLWKAIGADSCDPDLVQDVDVIATVLEYHQRIVVKFAEWREREAERSQDPSATAQPQHEMRLKLIANAMKLIVLGAGFHYSVRHGQEPHPEILRLSIETALTCVRVHIEELYPAGVLGTLIEPHFLYVTYAAAFLVNLAQLLKANYTPLLDPVTRTTILKEVRALIGVYLSKDVALDRAHPPAVYGRFLAAHLDRIVDGQELARTPQLGPEDIPLPPDMWDLPGMPLELGGGAQHPMPLVDGGAGGDLWQGADFCFENFVTDVNALGPVPEACGEPGGLGLGLVPALAGNPLDEQTWWASSAPCPPLFDQSALDLATFAMDEAYLQMGW